MRGAAVFVVLEKLRHVEDGVSRVDPDPVEREEVLDEKLVGYW